MKDSKMQNLIEKEQKRQNNTIELIASENFVSKDVLEATGSILTNKYAEGYPGNRYYGGCCYIDEIENLAIERLKKLFNVKYANVQPHSGSQANAGVYQALLKPGDKILGMSLNAGGHLTHGYKINFSGILYKSYFYGVNKETHMINYDEVEKIALRIKPKLIIAGASAYPRIIDFKKFRQIADRIGAFLFVDMAHISGLVAAGLHPSPIKYAHVVSSTTHKTLRGPRGGFILTNDEKIATKINQAIFPGTQGGPLMHVIAGKGIAFWEALKPDFKKYQKQVVENAKLISKILIEKGIPIISGGTDNHLLLVNVKKGYGITGKLAEDVLASIGIIVNKNTIPFDKELPTIASGIRIGTPAITSHGFKKSEIIKLVDVIHASLQNTKNVIILQKQKQEVKKLLEVTRRKM